MVISFDFPPRRTSATYRLGNLTRYLLSPRWQPTVLTIKIRPEDLAEPEQFQKISRDIRIERTAYWRVSKWEAVAHKTVKSAGAFKSPAMEVPPTLFDRALRRLAAFVRSCLYFPDYSVGWVPFGVGRGLRLIRKQRFDVIFTSEPPRAASVVGLFLKLLTGIPWVFEVMDPWYPPDRPWRRRFEHWLFGLMLRRADAVVVMTEGHKQDLHERFVIPESKLHVIPNGFDEEDFHPDHAAMVGTPTEMCSPGYIHFSHFGTVYPRNAGRFFPALAELLAETPELRQRVRIHMVGFPDQSIRRFVQESGLGDVVEFREFITSHAQVLREMYATHCLLLFWGDREFSRLAAAGKTYVYLRTGRPILAVTGPGTIEERVQAAGAGWVVSPDDPSQIKAKLREVIGKLERNEPMPGAKSQDLDRFRWDRLAAQLAEVLDGVVDGQH
jgi:glycosyltransferase involved in cell wall biosynthesis